MHGPTPPTSERTHQRQLRRRQPAPWVLGLLLVAHAVGAQTLYRSVGPDGRVTYSDLPPASPTRPAQALVASPRAGSASDAASPSLPYVLQQVVSRYPITLYTTAACPACDAGRRYLQQRGIPYSERTVSTAEDAQALQQQTQSSELPVLRIGNRIVKGYSETEWRQYLDAAGYPASNQLPPGYRPRPPAPLAEPRTDPATAAAASPASATASDAPSPAAAPNPRPLPPRPADNPAGIRF